ncbi:4Fe-4S dicluster domain-containing protein [Chloroflexota bacterium]
MASGTIVINEMRCKGCGLCVTACSKQLIALDSGRVNANGYTPATLFDADRLCTGCALCALMCPDVGITVYRDMARDVALVAVPVVLA